MTFSVLTWTGSDNSTMQLNAHQEGNLIRNMCVKAIYIIFQMY